MSLRIISTLAGVVMLAGALADAPTVAAAPMQVPSTVVAGASQPLATTHVYYCRFGRCYRRYGYRRYYGPRYYGYNYGYRRYYAPGLTFRLFSNLESVTARDLRTRSLSLPNAEQHQSLGKRIRS